MSDIKSVFGVSRKIFKHSMFFKGELTRTEAWVWMIGNACWKDTDIFIGNRKITLKRGQLSYSVRYLAESWCWSKAKIERFFSVLKTETMIGTETGTGQLIITICNYDDYQFDDKKTGTETGTETGTPTRTPTRTNKNTDNTDNTSKSNISPIVPLEEKSEQLDLIPNRFPEFWEHFPKTRAGSRAKAEIAFRKALEREKEDVIIAAVIRYKASPEVASGYAKGAAAWLNDDRWTSDYGSRPTQFQNQNQNARPGNPVKSRKVIV